jgi:hypothetical protein
MRNFIPLPNDHRFGDVLTQNGAMETQDGWHIFISNDQSAVPQSPCATKRGLLLIEHLRVRLSGSLSS